MSDLSIQSMAEDFFDIEDLESEEEQFLSLEDMDEITKNKTLERILSSEKMYEQIKKAGLEIEKPDYVKELGDDVLAEISDYMKDAAINATNNEAYFRIEDIKRNFMKIINDKINAPKALQYVSASEMKGSKISEYAIKSYEEAKKIAEMNKKKVETYLKSQHRNDIVDYLLKTAVTLIPIGDIDPNNAEQQKYTTPEIIELEKIIRDNALDKSDKYVIKDKEIVENAIGTKKPLISEEQINAVYECVYKESRISIVEGVAGAGKSFTMEAVKEAFEKSAYKVMGTALSWNAAGVLRGSAKIDDCRAIEGLIRDMEKAQKEGKEFFEQDTLLIVDEAGLIGLKHMAKLLKLTNASSHKIKIVLTGDTQQLDPVSAGASLSLLTNLLGSQVIKTIRRQALESHRNMVYAFKERRSGHGLNYLLQQEAIKFCKNDESVLNSMVMDFINYKYNNPQNSALLLAYTNKQVVQLNEMIRKVYKKLGFVYGYETDKMYVSDGRNKPWLASFAVGDEVTLRLNDKSIPVYKIPDGDERKEIYEKNLNVSEWEQVSSGVFNRNSGKIIGVTKMTDGSFTLVIEMVGDVSGRILINTKKYQGEANVNPTNKKKAFPVIHNFATTVYASQGQTVDAVFLKDDSKFDFRLAYVGASRHRKEFKVYASVEDLTARIQKKKGKILPNEVLKEAVNTNNYDLDPKKMPVAQRYGVDDYLAEMSACWGKYSIKQTVTGYENEQKAIKKGAKPEHLKSVFTIEDDTVAKNAVINDTCIPDYIAKQDTNLVLIALELGKIKSIDNIADEDSKDFKEFQNWVSKVCKINEIDHKNLNIPKDRELFFDEKFSKVLPKEIDFVAIKEMTEDEVLETEQVKPIDIYTQEKQALEDIDNVQKIDQKRVKELEDKDKKARAINSVFTNPLFEELLRKNDEYNPDPVKSQKAKNIGSFSYADYNNSDRYAFDMSKNGGGLDRGYIEISVKNNRVMPPKREVPIIQSVKKDAYVNDFGELRFNKIEAMTMTKDDQEKYNSLVRLIKGDKGKYWDVGRYKQPRIIANELNKSSPKGRVRSRYDLEGNCVSGAGYPPVFYSYMPDDCHSVLITPDFYNSMATYHFYQTKNLELIEKNKGLCSSEELMEKVAQNFPNIIWGAKDVDWGLVLKNNENYAKKFLILISSMEVQETLKDVKPELYKLKKKEQQQQQEWAKNLQEKLYDQYNVEVGIKGIMPKDFIPVFKLRESERVNFEKEKTIAAENIRNKRMRM